MRNTVRAIAALTILGVVAWLLLRRGDSEPPAPGEPEEAHVADSAEANAPPAAHLLRGPGAPSSGALAEEDAARRAANPKDVAAFETLRTMRSWLSNAEFGACREAIDGFSAKHPEASDALKTQFETLKTEFGAQRSRYFAEQAGEKFAEIVKQLIQAKVAPEDVAYNDIQAWARNEALDAAFAELTTLFQAKDPLVTPEETKTFFDARPKNETSWRTASYGAGSFLIEPPSMKPHANEPTAGGSAEQGPSSESSVPPLPTRDGWWAKATPEERTQFYLGLLVEKSGLFEFPPKRDHAICPLCNGDGTISTPLLNGTKRTSTCPRCGGSGSDVSVKYR